MTAMAGPKVDRSSTTGDPGTEGEAGRPLGRLRRAVRKWAAEDPATDADDLQRAAASDGCQTLASCCPGVDAAVTGRIRSVVIKPQGSVPTLEADLFDGSGSVTLIWMGRRCITGIEPGRSLRARGRIADCGGRRVIFNPWYELKRSEP